jgi:hypothetical protein
VTETDMQADIHYVIRATFDLDSKIRIDFMVLEIPAFNTNPEYVTRVNNKYCQVYNTGIPKDDPRVKFVSDPKDPENRFVCYQTISLRKNSQGSKANTGVIYFLEEEKGDTKPYLSL